MLFRSAHSPGSTSPLLESVILEKNEIRFELASFGSIGGFLQCWLTYGSFTGEQRRRLVAGEDASDGGAEDGGEVARLSHSEGGPETPGTVGAAA